MRLRSAKTSHLGSVYITMVNGTSGSVTAWWVDFDGNEVRMWDGLRCNISRYETSTARCSSKPRRTHVNNSREPASCSTDIARGYCWASELCAELTIVALYAQKEYETMLPGESCRCAPLLHSCVLLHLHTVQQTQAHGPLRTRNLTHH